MADLRKLFFSIGFRGDPTQIKKMDSAADQLKNKMSGLNGTIKTIGATVVAAFAVDKIVEFGKSAIESAGSAKAIASQFTQTFGDLEPAAKDAVNTMAGQFGMVPERLTPAMAQMTSMFKGLGMDTADAMSEATNAVTMSADAAAFYDKSFSDANSALTSFVKGNYEGGEAIGLFANDTQLAAYAVSQGLVGATKDWASLGEATKQATRLDYAQNMQQLAGATGQAARESDGYENQLGNINQAWKNFLAIVGGPVLGGVVNIMKNITTGLKTAGEKVVVLQNGFNGLGDPGALSGLDADLYKVGQRLSGIVDGLVTVAGKVGDFINATGGFDGVVSKLELLIKAFIALKAAMAIIDVIDGLSAAYSILTGAMGALSVANLKNIIETGTLQAMYAKDFLVGAISSVKTLMVEIGLLTAAKVKDIARSALWHAAYAKEVIVKNASIVATKGLAAAQWLWNAAMNANPIMWIITGIGLLVAGVLWLWNTNEGFRNAVIGIWNNIVSGLQQAGQSIGEIWNGIVNGFQAAVAGIQTAWGNVVAFFQGIWAGIVAVFNAVVGFFVGIYVAEWNGIMAVWNGAVGFFSGIVSGIAGAFSGISGFITGAFDGAMTFMSELPGKFLQWGADMIAGLIQGVKDKVSGAVDAIKGVATGISDAFKSFFNINSPSKLMREYGSYLSQGIAIGIKDDVPDIDDATRTMTIAALPTSTETTPRGNARYSGSSAPVTFKTEIHVNVGAGADAKEVVSNIEKEWIACMERYEKKMALRNPPVTA